MVRIKTSTEVSDSCVNKAGSDFSFCQENGVKSLPTSFIYDGAEIVKVVVGNKYQEIKEALESV